MFPLSTICSAPLIFRLASVPFLFADLIKILQQTLKLTNNATCLLAISMALLLFFMFHNTVYGA